VKKGKDLAFGKARSRPESGTPDSKSKAHLADNKKKSRETRTGAKRDPKQIVMSRQSAIIWGMILCVFIIWVFSLGILVGRGFFFQNERFKKLEERISHLDADRVPNVTVEKDLSEPSVPQPALTFYKSLTQGKIESGSGLKKGREPSSPSAAQPQKKKSDRLPLKTAADVKGRPASVSESLSRPASRPKSEVQTLPEGLSGALPPARSQGRHFTIQVAAVENLDQARQLVISLREKGYPAYYYHVQHKSRRYFRIRVGYYKNRAEAETVMKKLKKIGRKDMFISRLED